MLTKEQIREIEEMEQPAHPWGVSAGAQKLWGELEKSDHAAREGLAYWLIGYLDCPAVRNESVDANAVLAAMARFLERNREPIAQGGRR